MSKCLLRYWLSSFLLKINNHNSYIWKIMNIVREKSLHFLTWPWTALPYLVLWSQICYDSCFFYWFESSVCVYVKLLQLCLTLYNPMDLTTVFVDRDLGTGVDEKRDSGDMSLEWNKGALFAEMHVYLSSYKAALGSKKTEQKQSQANNNLQRARKHSIPWVREA